MFYNSDFHNWVYYTDQDFQLHVGKEVIWRIHNPYSTTLFATSAVYLSGSSDGVLPDAYLAIADGTNTKSNVVGLIRWDILSGSYGYVLCNGVMHNVDVDHATIGAELWLSSAIPGDFTEIQPMSPYERVSLGNCQQTSTTGSFAVNIVKHISLPFADSGILSEISIVNNNDDTITVSTGSVALFSDSTGNGITNIYNIPQTTFTLTTGSFNYISAQQSGSTIYGEYVQTTENISNGINIIPIAGIDAVILNSGSLDLHIINYNFSALTLANRIANKDEILYGYQRQDGITLYTSGSDSSLAFGVTSGNVWYGPVLHSQREYQSWNTASSDTYHWVNSGSIWSIHTQAGFDNGSYNSADGLTNLAPLSWSVNFIYRLVSDDGSAAAIVLSSAQYSTELEASNNAQPPANLPEQISSIGMLVGALVVQSGSLMPTVKSAYTSTFVPAVVTDHNSLLKIQGGQGGQYYHLTSVEYTGTGTGAFVRQTNSSITGSITSAMYSINSTSSSYANNTLTASYVDAGSITTGILGNSRLPNQINITGITASLNGTSSWSNNSVSASYGLTASYSNNSISASYVPSSSYALTANTAVSVSAVDAGIINSGTLNNSRLSSQINITGITGSHYGTSSWANNSLTASSINFTPVMANTASYVLGGSVSGVVGSAATASYLNSGTYTVTSSWSNNSTSSSFAVSSSYSVSGSWSTNSGQAGNALVAGSAGSATSASYATNASNAVTASYISAGNLPAHTSSWATNSLTASSINFTPVMANTASYVDAGNITTGTLNNSRLSSQINITGITGSHYGTSSWANNVLTASYLNTGTYTITSSWSNNAVSSSYVLSASYAPDAVTSSYANNSLSASYSNSSSYAMSSSYVTSASYLFGTIGVSTTSSAALQFKSGSLLTTASAGVVEYDGINFYGTIDGTSGRGSIPIEQYFLLTQTGSGITNSAVNFFGTTSNISLAPNGIYEINIILFFTKSGAGGVGTYTFVYNTAPISLNFELISSPVAGIISPTSTANNNSYFSQIYNNTSSPYSYTDGSNLSNATHYRNFKILLIAGATTNYMKIQSSVNAGTIVQGIGSRWYAKRLSSNDVGTFAA